MCVLILMKLLDSILLASTKCVYLSSFVEIISIVKVKFYLLMICLFKIIFIVITNYLVDP